MMAEQKVTLKDVLKIVGTTSETLFSDIKDVTNIKPSL